MTKTREDLRLENKNKTLQKGAKKNLAEAKKKQNNEYYTRLVDIENELKNYKKFLKDKIIFCNCDDPEWSNFYKYFKLNFEYLGLKKLISTHYSQSDKSYKMTAELVKGKLVEKKSDLESNGDYRSDECMEILRSSDIVITNPPFSLTKEIIPTLIKEKKDFILITPPLSLGYKDINPYVINRKIRVGYTGRIKEFFSFVDGNEVKASAAAIWITSLKINDSIPPIELTGRYKGYESKYEKFYNYDAINVNSVGEIPADYFEEMGVPVTFLEKWNHKQFEIIRFRKGDDGKDLKYNGGAAQRVIIKRKK